MVRQGAAAEARRLFLDAFGDKVASLFLGVTRVGGKIVGALHLSHGPMSMDELSQEVGRAKSNVHSNLRTLESFGIVRRHREPGDRHFTFSLAGEYPDVIIGAFLSQVRRLVIHDHSQLFGRVLGLLGEDVAPEADALRGQVTALSLKYAKYSELFAMFPPVEGPIRLDRLVDSITPSSLSPLAALVKAASVR